MAVQTKVNPTPVARGTLYSTLQLKVFVINPDAEIAVSNPVILADAPTRLAEEFGTTGALFQVKSDGGSMIVIGDGHALDVDIVKRRAARVLGVAESAVTVTESNTLYGL